jgi:ABC-2 type transport system ATP-binding protein
VLRRTGFVREDQIYPDFAVRHPLRAASWFYPNWDAEQADELLAAFDLPVGRAIKKLSRGMRSALGIIIGLAARAEVRMFDEPYAGLDAVAREVFYDRLLTDYAEHPRTVLLSTHICHDSLPSTRLDASRTTDASSLVNIRCVSARRTDRGS